MTFIYLISAIIVLMAVMLNVCVEKEQAYRTSETIKFRKPKIRPDFYVLDYKGAPHFLGKTTSIVDAFRKRENAWGVKAGLTNVKDIHIYAVYGCRYERFY